MSYKDFIESYSFNFLDYFPIYFSSYLFLIISSVSIFIFIFIAFFVTKEKKIKNKIIFLFRILIGKEKNLLFIFMGLFLTIQIFSFLISGLAEMDKNHKQVLQEYFETGEVQIGKINSVKIKDTRQTIPTYLGHIKSENLFYVQVILENGIMYQYEGYAQIRTELKEHEEPYVSFIEIHDDLPIYIDKGMYNVIIHVPKGYEFNY